MDQRDPDWYRLGRASASTVRVRLQNRSTTLKPSVTIYDENRSEILKQYDYTYGTSLDFTFEAALGKEYYIKVSPWDTFGSYDLSVE